MRPSEQENVTKCHITWPVYSLYINGPYSPSGTIDIHFLARDASCMLWISTTHSLKEELKKKVWSPLYDFMFNNDHYKSITIWIVWLIENEREKESVQNCGIFYNIYLDASCLYHIVSLSRSGRSFGILYCIILYCIVLYCIVLYCIALLALYCIVLYCIVLYW